MTFDKNDFSHIKNDNNHPPELWVIYSNIYEKLIERGFIKHVACPDGKEMMNIIGKTIIDAFNTKVD